MFLNEFELELIKEYPVDGTHDYYWPESGIFDGVTRELSYQGEVIAHPDELKRTYCCGLTWELWLRSCQLWAERNGKELDLNGHNARDLRRLKADWFVASGRRGGPVDALVHRGLGIQVTLEEARPGDFMQIWRRSGSGHSVVFLASVEGGIHYWSTQKATKGIGERTEYFYGDNWVKKDELYIARAIAPAVPMT